MGPAEQRKLGFKHHARVHSFRIATAILTWILLGAILFYKPEWIRNGMRAGTRAIEAAGDVLPSYWARKPKSCCGSSGASFGFRSRPRSYLSGSCSG
jgi:hypothetical protein